MSSDARRRLDEIGEALRRSASDALDGRRRRLDELHAQLLYSALMRIREHAQRRSLPVETRLEDIVLICEAALGTDGPPAATEERNEDHPGRMHPRG